MRGGICRSLGFRPRIFFQQFFLVRKFLWFFGVAEKEAEGGREKEEAREGRRRHQTKQQKQRLGSARLSSVRPLCSARLS
jgi:hypothetical protein